MKPASQGTPRQTWIALETDQQPTTPVQQPTRREVRGAVAITAVFLLAILLKGMFLDDPRGWDFSARYAAGLILRQGGGAKIYDIQEQARAQWQLFRRGAPLLELHPPFEILLYSPLSRLSYLQAYLLWGLINAALWMGSFYLLRPFVSVPAQTFQYMALAFAFFPLWVALDQGQTSILLLFLYVLTFISMKRGRDFAAGLWLALGLFKFALVLPFAFICLLRGKLRMIAGFAAMAAALGALSLVAVGTEGVVAYVGLLRFTATHPADRSYAPVALSNMPTLRGFLSVILRNLPSPVLTIVVALLTLALVLYTAWRWRQEDRRPSGGQFELMFAAALAVTVATAFYLYAHDLSPLALGLILALASWPAAKGSPWRWVFAIALVVVYAPVPYLVLGEWNRLYLLWPALLAVVLAMFGIGKRVSAADAVA